LRHHDAIELEQRVPGRIDERERAHQLRLKPDAHELPRLKLDANPLDAQGKERLGPVPVLDHPALEPLTHWTM
jgi:hypothetical protein